MQYLIKAIRASGKYGLALLLCLPLAGCLDVNQEIWVYDDGRGRMTTEVGLHEQLMLMQGKQSDESVCDSFFEKKEFLEKQADVESVVYKTYKQGGVFYCVSDIRVSDFTKLTNLQDASLKGSAIEANKDDFQTEFSLKLQQDGNGFFRQHIRNQSGDPGKHKLEAHAEKFTNVIMGHLMTGRYWSLTLHTPKIVDANAKISEDNKTVSWRVPLYDLLTDEQYAFDMQASFEVKIPWYKKFWNWIT